MYVMFYVRSARALSPSLQLGIPSACVPRAPPRRPHPLPPLGPSLGALEARIVCIPSLPTRQWAKAFNQPLSFNTSKVHSMKNMFYVPSARALGPL